MNKRRYFEAVKVKKGDEKLKHNKLLMHNIHIKKTKPALPMVVRVSNYLQTLCYNN